MANVLDGGLASTGERVLAVDALNTVSGVDVLDKGDLPASSGSLAGGNSGVSEEELPDLARIS